MAKEEKPDLILMDLSLPEMDGWTATERIKSDPETGYIPIAAADCPYFARGPQARATGWMRRLSFETDEYFIVH